MEGINRVGLTAIILTQDEEKNIAACLESLSWVSQVIVVDSGSRDATLEVARGTRPDVEIHTHPFADFGQQRNWALENTPVRSEWVLFVDADERIPAACAREIGDRIADPQGCVGFYLCNRYWFMGRWIRHCTLFPSWQLRLLRKGRVRFVREGHGQREVADGPLGYIREPYDHFGFSKGISEWVSRHNRYSSMEVELILRLRREPVVVGDLLRRDPVRRRRAVKRLAARVPCRPLIRFAYTYFFRRGFLDGRPGLVFCLLRLAHEIHVWAKLQEAEWTHRTTGTYSGDRRG